jgi:hypothetical protein
MHDTLAAASASLRWSRPENMMASMLMDAIAFSSIMRRPLREQRIRRDDGKRDVFRCSAGFGILGRPSKTCGNGSGLPG